MSRTIFCLLIALIFFCACKKNSNKYNPANSQLTVAMDTATGSVLTRGADTFLIRLRVPDSIRRVPLVYTLSVGARPGSGSMAGAGADLGERGEKNVWRDTVDLSENIVFPLKVTFSGGNTHQYYIAFEYSVVTYQLPATGSASIRTAQALFAVGNDVYIGTSDGLAVASGNTPEHKVFPGLSNTVVTSVYVRGSTIFAGNDNGLAVSTDGGTSFHYGLGGENTPLSVWKVAVQGDTVYAAAENNVYISRDNGVSFDSSTGFAHKPIGSRVWSIAASGSRVYAGAEDAFYISTDGGRHFTADNFVLPQAPNGNFISLPVLDIALNGNEMYIANNNNISISSDGGQTFTDASLATWWPSEASSGVAVSGNTVCGASPFGLLVSQDGGGTYSHFHAMLGLFGLSGYGRCTAVAMKENVIYAAFDNALAVLTPR